MLLAMSALIAAVCTPGLAIAGAAGDQARLDEAIDGFNERMIEAGWVSEGPADDEDEDEDDADDDADDDVWR